MFIVSIDNAFCILLIKTNLCKLLLAARLAWDVCGLLGKMVGLIIFSQLVHKVKRICLEM